MALFQPDLSPLSERILNLILLLCDINHICFGFDLLYKNDTYNENNYLRVEVLSDEGELLRTWPLIESETSEDRFYEESSWRFYHPKGDTYVWVFDLLPEDLLPE